jgi:hypothetical protein
VCPETDLSETQHLVLFHQRNGKREHAALFSITCN